MPTEAIFQFPPGLFVRPFPKEISRQDLPSSSSTKGNTTNRDGKSTDPNRSTYGSSSSSPHSALHTIINHHKSLNNGKDSVTETRRQSRMRTVAHMYGVEASSSSMVHGLSFLNRPSSRVYDDGHSGRAVLRQPLTTIRSTPNHSTNTMHAGSVTEGTLKTNVTILSSSTGTSPMPPLSRSSSPAMGFMSTTFSPMNLSQSNVPTPSRGYSPSPSPSSVSSGRASPTVGRTSSSSSSSSSSSPAFVTNSRIPHLLDTPSVLYAERSLILHQNKDTTVTNAISDPQVSPSYYQSSPSSSSVPIKRMFPPEEGEDDLDVTELMKENGDELPFLSSYVSASSSPLPPLSSSPMHSNFVRPAPIHTNIPPSTDLSASFISPFGNRTTVTNSSSSYPNPSTNNDTLQEELLNARANLSANERVQIREIRSSFTPYLFSDLLETYHFFASSKVPAYSIAVWTIAANVFKEALRYYSGPLTTNPSNSGKPVGTGTRSLSSSPSVDRDYALSLCSVLSRCIAGTYNPNTETGPPPTVHGTWAPAKVAVQFACNAMEQQGRLKQILDNANNVCNTTLRKATVVNSTKTKITNGTVKDSKNSSPLSTVPYSRSASPTGSVNSVSSRASPLSLPQIVSVSPMTTVTTTEPRTSSSSPVATTRAKYSTMAHSITTGSFLGTNRTTIGSSNGTNQTSSPLSASPTVPLNDSPVADVSYSSLRYNPYNRKVSPPSHKISNLYYDGTTKNNSGITLIDNIPESASIVSGGDPRSLESSFSIRSGSSTNRSPSSSSPSSSQRARSPYRSSTKWSNESSLLPPMPVPIQEPYLQGNAALLSTRDIAATSLAYPAPPHCLLDAGQPGAIPNIVLRGSKDAPPLRMVTSDGIIDGTNRVRGGVSSPLRTENSDNPKKSLSYTLLYDGTYPAIRAQNDSLSKAVDYAIPKHYSNSHYNSVIMSSRYAYGPSTTYNAANPRSRMPAVPGTDSLRRTYIAATNANGESTSPSVSPMKDGVKEANSRTVFASVRPMSVSTRLTYTTETDNKNNGTVDPHATSRSYASVNHYHTGAPGLSYIRTVSPLVAASDTYTIDSTTGISAVIPDRAAAESGLIRARTAYTEYDKLLALTKRVP